MPRWQRQFRRWQHMKSPAPQEEVVHLLHRVFGDRLRHSNSSSHEYQIRVEELKGHPKFRFGLLTICVSGGQVVKGPYLQKAYEAAMLLGLVHDADRPEEGDEENDTDHKKA